MFLAVGDLLFSKLIMFSEFMKTRSTTSEKTKKKEKKKNKKNKAVEEVAEVPVPDVVEVVPVCGTYFTISFQKCINYLTIELFMGIFD